AYNHHFSTLSSLKDIQQIIGKMMSICDYSSKKPVIGQLIPYIIVMPRQSSVRSVSQMGGERSTRFHHAINLLRRSSGMSNSHFHAGSYGFLGKKDCLWVFRGNGDYLYHARRSLL